MNHIQYLPIAKVTLVLEIPHGELSNFDKILTNNVKIQQIHVEQIQGRDFIRNKKLLLHNLAKGL